MDRERGSISSNGGRVIELNKEVLYADAIVARVTERIKAVPVVVVSGLTNERDALSVG